MIRHLKTRLRPQIYYAKGTSRKLISSCTSLNTSPYIRTELPSLHPSVTNLLMYWILPILQALHMGAMRYKRLYAPLSVETCMNNSILQYHDMLVGYILIVGSA